MLQKTIHKLKYDKELNSTIILYLSSILLLLLILSLWIIIKIFGFVVHIGNIIHNLVTKSSYSVQEVADYMNMSRSNLFSIYKRAEIDNYKLAKFSELFATNLFEHYIDKSSIKQIFSSEFSELEVRIKELESQLQTRKQELLDKDEIIVMLKKVVSLYEQKEI